MNSEIEYKNWSVFFSNLGSRTTPRFNKNAWLDLEHFIVLGAKYAIEDSRSFTSFIVMCIHLSPILSPFKIKKIALRELKEEQFNILGYIISKIQQNVRNPTQWNGLILLCQKKMKKHDEIVLFSSKAFKVELEFKEWNINASRLELDDHEKYLNTQKLYSHSIVRHRFSGVKTVYSDIYFYRLYHEEVSLHKMSKEIFHDYNTVYQANELMIRAS
jgi:hypothetical protein